tara:strand:- start:36016 stop:36891 length:876 start_codon:yes stop_codon:yes gene_type:complete
MALYKNVSSLTIIRKVMRDLKPTNDNWTDDAIEWIGEALEHIGASPQLETKNCVCTVKEYKTSLPADLYYINQVSINAGVSVSTTTELDEVLAKIEIINEQLADNPNQDLSYELRDLNTRVSILSGVYFSDSNNNNLKMLSYGRPTFRKDIHALGCDNEFSDFSESYVIENNLIKTSFKDGKVCLSYTAFPLDENCYPLVPDDISFREAMFWYIYKKMLLGGYMPNVNGMTYQVAEQQWKYYCTQARNAANFPDIAGYESFLNQWVRLIPNINRHDDNFRDINKRENLVRD